jgi:ferric-dicitrate binding protein FerR (iron transport regulator)
MMLFVPVAKTSKDYEWASGIPPVTAQELVDRARKGIEDFANSGEWTYWKNNWKQESEKWKEQHKAWKHQGKAWQRMQKNQWKAEQRRMRYEHRSSAVSELFGIACATLAITFVLWFLYGHVTVVHDFFNALHTAYDSFINSLARVTN